MQEQGGCMPDTALVLIARYQERGTTKTRLAEKFAGQAYDVAWAYTPSEVDYLSFIATLAPTRVERMRAFPQQGIDLGARLHHVFQRTHHAGYQYIIVIGSDSPHISPHIIMQ